MPHLNNTVWAILLVGIFFWFVIDGAVRKILAALAENRAAIVRIAIQIDKAPWIEDWNRAQDHPMYRDPDLG